VIQREHGVRFAASEVGLQLDYRISAMLRESDQCVCK
jgi:hypothetical protein